MSGPSASLGGLGINGSPSLPGESTWDTSLPPEKQLVQYKTSSETWEQKLEKTKEVQKEREKALESLGITIEKNLLGVHTPKKVRLHQFSLFGIAHRLSFLNAQMPHLVNLNEDPLMSECLICQSRSAQRLD